jgi:two-component system, OmpR family, sensor histidine kinase KdpD
MSDWRHRARRGVAYHTAAALFSAAGVSIVTGVVFGLREIAPVVSLGVLYLFAVLPVAVVWGLAYAIPVSILSMLAFNWFFLPPTHTLALRESENWVALAVYLFTAVVVSELAARSRRRAADAEQREREASLLAAASARLLRSGDVHDQLRQIAADTARALGASAGRIEVGSLRRPDASESARDLQVDARKVGRLFLEAGAITDREVEARLLPAVASLLAVASERERLGRKALEAEALRRSDAAKTAVLRAVSHDLRSPLTAIRAASEGLESGALELTESDRATLLETIRIEAMRLERLVANLLDLSLLEADAAQPEPALWTVDDLITRALDALGADADRVVASLPPEPPLVRVDAGQLERVLANLIENALKFSPPGTRVDVGAAVAGGEVAIRVRDRGPGIPTQERGRIFEPFSRGGRGGGSGLGLAIAQGFAQANGASLSVEPNDGSGTTFVLAIPVTGLPAPVT